MDSLRIRRYPRLGLDPTLLELLSDFFRSHEPWVLKVLLALVKGFSLHYEFLLFLELLWKILFCPSCLNNRTIDLVRSEADPGIPEISEAVIQVQDVIYHVRKHRTLCHGIGNEVCVSWRIKSLVQNPESSAKNRETIRGVCVRGLINETLKSLDNQIGQKPEP